MSDKDFERKMLNATIKAAFVSMIGGLAIGCAIGLNWGLHVAKTKTVVVKPCRTYTVLQPHWVVDCKGDTVFYDWEQSIKYVPYDKHAAK